MRYYRKWFRLRFALSVSREWSLRMRPIFELVPSQIFKAGIFKTDANDELIIISSHRDLLHFSLLAGCTFISNGRVVTLGLPLVEKIEPTNSLHAQLVIHSKGITGHSMAEYALNKIYSWRLAAGEYAPCSAQVKVVSSRTLKVGHLRLRGWELLMNEISDEVSMALQISGLGARRNHGCGLVMPAS